MQDYNKKRCVQLQVADNLLPGIPREVTLNKITPKLSWRDMYTLSSVSRAWNYAVRSRQVYNESLPSRSTGTFILSVSHYHGTISLYSLGESSWYKLPLIPNHRGRIPLGSKCVSVNGRIYVLGGYIKSEIGRQVFVFDVAGGGQWEQCASMKVPRQSFACAVKDRKIYVFGGQCDIWSDPANSAEVYDPEENAWSPTKPMKSLVLDVSLSAVAVGEELFVRSLMGCTSSTIEAYHPLKDEWRTVQHSLALGIGDLEFNAQGKIHTLRKRRIHFPGNVGARRIHFPVNVGAGWIYDDESLDFDDHSSTHWHSFSLNGLSPSDFITLSPRSILHVEDELLAIAELHKKEDEDGEGVQRGHYLLQSRGFGSENKEISWKLRDSAFSSQTSRCFTPRGPSFIPTYSILEL